MAVRALVFDVFGTLVDWRSGVADAFRASGVSGDPYELADAWRARYRPILAEVNDGARPVGRASTSCTSSTLDDLLAERGARALRRRRGASSCGAWHRLDPWPDVRAGLEALRARAPGGDALQRPRRPARRPRPPRRPALRLPSSRPSSPGPTSRRRRPTAPPRGCSACSPAELMLAAAHPWDLEGARDAGLKHRVRRPPARVRAGLASRARIPTPTRRSATCASSPSG